METSVEKPPVTDDAVQAMPEKIPIGLKIFGVINIIFGVKAVIGIVMSVVNIADYLNTSETDGSFTLTALVLGIACVIVLLVLGTMFVVIGVRLLLNKRRLVSQLSYAAAIVCVVLIVLTIWTVGMDVSVILVIVDFVYLMILATFVDPSLREERQLQRKLRDMETRTDAEEGTLGRDKTGKGYIKLDFFNMFWICIIGCVIGLIFETCYVGITTGIWHNRTGMLWGPFSPIFGIGALLMVIATNRFYNKNIALVFIVTAFVGAIFEYFVSYFLQMAFGIVAWDYSDAFLNIDGRTDLFHFLAWGFLGCIFVRYLTPLLLKIINLIPWKWRYSVTAVFAVFMLVNATLTLFSFDRWCERLAGVPATTGIEEWLDETYPNDWMQNHFESISINPDNTNNMDSTAGKTNSAAGTT